MPASFTPDPNAGQLQQSGGMPSSFTPDNSLSFGQSKALLGHSNSLFMGTSGLAPTSAFTVQGIQQAKQQIGGALPTVGAIGGGLVGAAGGAFVGGPVGAYAGGVAGSGAGAALGESANEALTGQKQQPEEIAKQGGINAALDAVGGPILSAGGKLLGGVVGGIASKVGDSFVGKGVSNLLENRVAAREASTLAKTLTPKLTPSEVAEGITNSAKKGTEFDASSMDSVKKASQSVVNVAKALGKKASDIVQTGVKKSIENASNLGSAISDYSKKIVSPFLEKSGANYNFADLQKSLGIIKPSTDLKGEALSTYNSVRQKILSTIANKISPAVTGGKNIGELTSMATNGTIPAKVSKGDEDFWDARKIIDQVVDDATKGKAFGDKELQGAKAAYKDMRNGFARYLSDAFRYPGQMENVNRANEFLGTKQASSMDKTGWNISDFEKQFGLQRTPQSEQMESEWKDHMSNLSGMYDALENVVTKGKQEFGKSWSDLYSKAHPITASTLKYGAEAIGAGALYEGAKSVGAPLP